MMKPNANFAFLSDSITATIFRSLVVSVIIYCTILSDNASNRGNFVHSRNVGSFGTVDHNIAPTSTLDLLTPFWSPTSHPQNKRQTHPNDSLTESENDSISFSPSSHNNPFDLLGNFFRNRTPRPKPATSQPVSPNDSLDAHVRKILIPRVSGTKGNVEVRNYIVDTLHELDYNVSLDQFTDNTPIGKVKFANIIATSNPQACRQLAIACHHDSKMMEGFLGAIDSAVPCAMMLELAQTFRHSFRPDSDSSGEEPLGLMFIFFDGEEAFVEWTDTDSLYGSRHLAARWEQQHAPKHCKGLANELKRLELLMVLDLIGTSDTSFTMYSRKLEHHYKALQKYEKEYVMNRFHLAGSQTRQHTTFKNQYIPLQFMQDDHVPFYQRGVPILSLLAHPFPSVWHKIEDNYDAIDFAKTKQILHALERFVMNYSKK